jgi:hypothetical protein
MFILDGKPLSPDVAFTDPATGVQYPANWLRLASPEERAAIGITEVPDPTPYDQRFYWGLDLPKDHAQLVEQWTQQTRATANTLLQPSDWLVIREADNGVLVPDEVKARRQEIRDFSGTKVAAIEATITTEELAAYITSADYSAWDAAPTEPEPALVPYPTDGKQYTWDEDTQSWVEVPDPAA